MSRRGVAAPRPKMSPGATLFTMPPRPADGPAPPAGGGHAVTRDPARDGSDFTENETDLWRRPQRRPRPHTLERTTIKAHALAHISRSARRSGTSRPERRAALDRPASSSACPELAPSPLLPRTGRATPSRPSEDPHADEPTAVASAAGHPELARILAVEIATAAVLARSAPAEQVGPAAPAPAAPADPGAPAEQVGPADATPSDPGAPADQVVPADPEAPAAIAPAAASAPAAPDPDVTADADVRAETTTPAPIAWSAALAPVATPVERARLRSPSVAPARAAIGRPRRRARARVPATARRRRLPLAALLILIFLWAAAYQQAWSALSMSERCRAALRF